MIPSSSKSSLLPASLAFLYSCCFLISGGCHNKKKKPTAKQKYAAWRKAITNNDCKKLYSLLDEKSHWAILSLTKDARHAARLIKKHYPKNRQSSGLSRLGPATKLSPKDWMTQYCHHNGLMKELKPLAAAPKETQISKKSFRVINKKGHEILFLRDDYGRWGCNVLLSRLKKLQIRMANILKLTKENVGQFEKH